MCESGYWGDSHFDKYGQNGHLAIGPCATNSGKWGIPEKNNTNVAQQ